MIKLILNEEYSFSKLKPFCAVCNKLVDKMKYDNDFLTHTSLVTVYCHGEEESCRVTKKQILDGIESGIAFQHKRITHQDALKELK